MYRRKVGRLAAAVAASLLLVSCRQIVDFKDEPPAATSACGLPYTTTSCASCVSASCCTPSMVCAGDPTCAAYFSCVGACAMGDWECRSRCLLDHPVGAAPGYAPLTACVSSNCESECGLTCGGLDYFSPPGAAAGCQACLVSNGDCSAERACASSAECVAYAQCQRLCATPDCRLACTMAAKGAIVTATEEAGVAASLSPYASTIDPHGACNASCAVGNNWTCLGHVPWPSGTTGAATLTSKVVDEIGGGIIGGVNVALCRLDSPCSPPIASTTADMQGNVILDASASVLGFSSDDYVQITSSSGSILPANYFLGYPVSRPLAPMALPYLAVVTPADVPVVAALVETDAGLLGTTGLTVGELVDCYGLPTPGATFTMEPPLPAPSREFYITSGGTPSVSETATSKYGIGGFTAVPPGTVTLTATPAGMVRPVSRATVLVQPGGTTTVFLFPTQ